jgi:hypothetical protein
MVNPFKVALLAGLALAISACGSIVGPTAQEMTLQSRNDELSTQISDLRQTATVESDRMMITAEYAATEVRAVAFQRDALRATLIARGTDTGFIDVTLPQNAGELPPGIDTDSLLPTPGSDNNAPPVTPPGAAPVATIDPAQIAATTPTPAAPATGARLVNPVLATGVGADDCASNSFTTFDSTATEIYVVATAVDFPANTVVTARWTREGVVMGSYDIPFGFEIGEACIWAFIDQSDFAFTPGSWTVEMLVNQQPAVGPIPFTITGPAPVTEGDAMDDMADGQ